MKFKLLTESAENKIVMISQPMNGLSEEDIQSVRKQAIDKLKSDGYTVLDTYFDLTDAIKQLNVKNEGVFYLARSLEAMSKCDAVYFCDEWESTRGCMIEHDVAESYGLELMYASEQPQQSNN